MAKKNEPQQIGDYLTVVDPTRGEIAKTMSPMPGSPQGQGNPANVISQMGQQNNMTYGKPNVYGSAYGDFIWNEAPQLNAVMPAPASPNPQNRVMSGPKSYNRFAPMMPGAPVGIQGDMMAASSYAADAALRGMNPSPMGAIGMPTTPAPGGVMPSPQQSPNTMPLNTPSPDQMAQMNSEQSKMNRGTRSKKGMRT